jgi:uncharacterized protein YjbI with pentapeptide repeats
MIPKRDYLKKILAEHSRWVFSLGKDGKLADVKNWKLDKSNLENEELPFAKLQFVSLKSANLSGINFRQADLLKGCFVGAYLDDADLAGANLSGGDLSFSKCMGANFADANLEGANLEGADLSETNFAKAILRCANFKGANLLSAEMVDANIEGANFQGAKLEGTNFEGANLFKANFDETYLRDLDVENLNLAEADHKVVNFSDSAQSETRSPEIELKTHHLDKTILNRNKSSMENLSAELNAVKPAIIEEAINGMIEKVKSNIKFDQLKAICKHQHFMESIVKIDFNKGDLVTHNDQVAFKLDFNITYNLSLVVDRKGNFINVFRSIKQIEK